MSDPQAPAWLRSPAEGTRPLFVRTRPQTLPFEQLTPRDFERLVCRLAGLDADVEHAQLYGVPGQDQGEIDLYCRLRDRPGQSRVYRSVQCRRLQTMKPGQVHRTVEAFLRGAWAARSAEFVLATPVSFTRTALAEAGEQAHERLRGAGIEWQVWDGESLTQMLRSVPELVCEFFGEDAARHFCDATTRRPTLPELLAYLDAAAETARRHPYAAAFRRVPALSDTYWPQEVGEQPRNPAEGEWDEFDSIRERRRLFAMWRAGRYALARESIGSRSTEPPQPVQRPGPYGAMPPVRSAPPLTVASVGELRPHAIVVGEPGVGKSSLLRRLIGVAGAYVPARVPAQALTGEQSMSQAIRSAVSADLGTALMVALRDDFFDHQPLPGVPWLVLVDGLDEITDETRREDVMRAVRRADPQLYRFMVTTRPLAAGELDRLADGLPQYWVRRLGRTDVMGLARLWFRQLAPEHDDPPVARFVHELEQSGIIGREGALPLLVSIACPVFVASPDHRLPRALADMYERFVNRLLDPEDDRFDPVASMLPRRAQAAALEAVDRRRELVEYLAAAAFTGNERSLADLAVERLEDSRPSAVDLDRWGEFVRELLRRAGPLVEQFGAFEFVHPRVRDYLAACYFAAEEQPSSTILERGLEPPEEPFVLFLAARWSAAGHRVDEHLRELLDREVGSPEDAAWVAELAGAMVAADIPVGPDVRDRIVVRLEQAARDPAVRWAYQLLTLDRLAAVDRESALRLLLEREQSSWTARWIAELDPDRGRAELQRLATTGPDRRSAAERLLEVDREAGIAALVALATTGPSSDRTLAASALARVDAARAADLLHAIATEDGPLDERIRAASALGAVRLDVAVAVLRGYLAGPVSDADRVAIADAVGCLRHDEGRELLRPIATSPAVAGPVRADAAGRLIMHGGDGAELLVAMLLDDGTDDESRDRALMWLAEIARERAVELFTEAASDPQRRCRATEQLAWLRR